MSCETHLTSPEPVAGQSVAAFIEAIRKLPSDEPVLTPGKWYRTQKEHWLRWLKEYGGPGAYGRLPGTKRSARLVYARIVEPRMLLWLIDSVGLGAQLPDSVRTPCSASSEMTKRSALIRRHVPWEAVAAALRLPPEDQAVRSRSNAARARGRSAVRPR